MDIEKLKIKKILGEYIKSIIECNYDLPRRIWTTHGSPTFIHPRGHEKGWNEIENNFYRKTMYEMFKNRLLKITGEPEIRIYRDNTSVVEFYWDFVASFQDSGEEIHTTGRESQVLIKQDDGEWKIEHIHYSRPPATHKNEGF